MHTKTVAQLAQGLQQKDFSSVELTQCFVDRISALDSSYNSFITVNASAALEAAPRRTVNWPKAMRPP